MEDFLEQYSQRDTNREHSSELESKGSPTSYFGHYSNDENPFPFLKSSQSYRPQQIWAVGGGKGGIGKTLVTSSLAISTARLGKRVVCIDLDLGGANLHTSLGVSSQPKYSLSDFINGKISSLSDAIVPSGLPYLNFICSSTDAIGIVDLDLEKKIKLLNGILTLDADFIVLDLGAGTHTQTIDFFLFADINLVAVNPDPTCIENTYRFIKTAYFRRLLLTPDLEPLQEVIRHMIQSNQRVSELQSPQDLYKLICREYPHLSAKFRKVVTQIEPKLILNQVRVDADQKIGEYISSVCKKYFGISPVFLGYLLHEHSLWQAIRQKTPFIKSYPNTHFSNQIENFRYQLIKNHSTQRNDLF